MLSAGVAAVSLVLLMSLVVPAPRTDTSSLAATPIPSPADRTVVTFAVPVETFAGTGSPLIWFPAQVSQVRGDTTAPHYVTRTVCVTAVGSNPPVHILVFDRTGEPMAAYTGGTTGRFIPLPQAYVGSGWLTVPCDTSDVFAPRLNRAR